MARLSPTWNTQHDGEEEEEEEEGGADGGGWEVVVMVVMEGDLPSAWTPTPILANRLSPTHTMTVMVIRRRRWGRERWMVGGWMVVVMVVIQDGLSQRQGTCPYGQVFSHLKHTT